MQEEKTVEAEQRAEAPSLGKFKSVEELVKSYEELESEFTRRSQRLRQLEEKEKASEGESARPPEAKPAVSEETKNEIIKEYLSTFTVPLMAGGGKAVAVPHDKPRSVADAGALALGYFREQVK